MTKRLHMTTAIHHLQFIPAEWLSKVISDMEAFWDTPDHQDWHIYNHKLSSFGSWEASSKASHVKDQDTQAVSQTEGCIRRSRL